MLDGLRESPLTMRAVIAWRAAIREGSMALREAIDIDAAHGSGPAVADDESDGPGRRNGRAASRPSNGANESDDEADEEKPLLSTMEAVVLPSCHGDPRRDCGGLWEAPASPGTAHRAGPQEPDADGVAE